MQAAYSPLKKLENLLGAVSSIYNNVSSLILSQIYGLESLVAISLTSPFNLADEFVEIINLITKSSLSFCVFKGEGKSGKLITY